MTKEFLPDYTAIPVGNRYRPAFRLFAGDNWRMISDAGKPVILDTFKEARDAAKDRVKAILNPKLTSMAAEEPVDPLGIAAWQAEREERHAEEVARAFGDKPVSRVFQRGREVEVEYRRRRA